MLPPPQFSAHLILLGAYMSADVRQTWHSIYLFVCPIPHMPTLPALDIHHQWHRLAKNSSLCDSTHWSGCPLTLHTPHSFPSLAAPVPSVSSHDICQGPHTFTPRFYIEQSWSVQQSSSLAFQDLLIPQKAEIAFTALLYSSVLPLLETKILSFLLNIFPSLFKSYNKNSYLTLKNIIFEVPFHTMRGRNQTEIHYSTWTVLSKLTWKGR